MITGQEPVPEQGRVLAQQGPEPEPVREQQGPVQPVQWLLRLSWRPR